jgi:hypothetical protein
MSDMSDKCRIKLDLDLQQEFFITYIFCHRSKHAISLAIPQQAYS